MRIPKKLTGIFPAAIMMVAASCGTPSLEEDETEIRRIRELSNTAIAAHDTAAFQQSLSPDYIIVSSRNYQVGKRENVITLGQDMSAKPDLVYRRTPQTIDIYPQWKMAGESGTWRGSWTEPNGDKIELTGTYYAKWHKLSDGWRIRAEIFTPLTCTGGNYCDQGPLH